MENVSKTELQTRIVELFGKLPEAMQSAFAAGYDLGASQNTPKDDDIDDDKEN